MKKLYLQVLRNSQKLLTVLVENVRLSTYFYLFAGIVVLLAVLYWFLTPFGHGVGNGAKPLVGMTFLQGLYFSVVTISSLGYGDMHPMGASKVVACLEVLFGLALMGIIIAKVTSRRLSYHVQRLFCSDAQKRLERFSTRFQKITGRLQKAMQLLGDAFQQIPGQETPKVKPSEAIKSFQDALSACRMLLSDTNEYIAYEIDKGDYFSIVPREEVLRLGKDADDSINRIGQLIISLSPDARIEALHSENRKLLSEILSLQKKICEIVAEHSKDVEMNACFDRVKEACNAVPSSYFAVPELGGDVGPPDQVADIADDPAG